MATEKTVKVNLKGDISDFQRALLAGSAGVKSFSKDLDSADGRMGNLVQTSLALGPALIPIGAAAVPAIAGLTNQLAFAAAGAGVAALAFQGVGTALDAVNKYSIDPTAANFKKLNESLAALGPEGQNFVMFLQRIRPELQKLQDAAQDGLFPGFESGITSMMDLLPRAEHIVGTIAKSIGDLIAEAGDNLNDPRWREFFAFIDREARPTLLDMGHTVGNFAEAFANLWMAFAPLSTKFSQSFLGLSRDFAQWTDGLDKTRDFQEFVDYINRVGPKAWDTLGALGNALLQIVEAAAPIGEATLPAITALSNVIATLADSNLGPLAIGIISVTSALSRMKALASASNSSAIGGLFGKSFSPEKLKVGAKQLGVLAVAQDEAGFSARNLGRSLAFASGDPKVRAGFGQFSKYAAGAAGLGLVMSGLDEKMGLTNTVSLALAGSLAGPWGAAIGGGIGLVKDLTSSSRELSAATDQVNAALANGATTLAQRNDLIKQNKLNAAVNKAVGNDDEAKKYTALADAVTQSIVAKDQARAAELGLTVDLKGTSVSLRDQTLAVLENIDAHNKRNNENLSASGKEIAYQAAIDATTESLKQNGRTLDINTPKGRANQTALDAQVAAWNNLAPASQLASGAQAKARAQIVAAGIAFGDSKKEAEAYATEMMNIPPDVVTAVKLLGTDASAAQIAKVIDGYNLTPKQIDTALKATDLTKPQIKAVNKALDLLDAKRANPKINVKDEATSAIETIIKKLGKLHDKTIVIRTNHETGKSTLTGGGKTATSSAAGNIFAAYAGGDIANGHQAELAGPGTTRVWREPETKGEAYIPLANDWRRPRAEAIWTQTGHLLGMPGYASGAVIAPLSRPQPMVSHYADGGFSRPGGSDGPSITLEQTVIAREGQNEQQIANMASEQILWGVRQ